MKSGATSPSVIAALVVDIRLECMLSVHEPCRCSHPYAQYNSATFLSDEGTTPVIDARHAITHDGVRVITGSFDFTKAAESNNVEKLLVIDDAELAAK